MLLRRFSTITLLVSFAFLVGCGGPGENVVNAPPETVSADVDADRAKEAGAPAPNVDYSKQQ